MWRRTKETIEGILASPNMIQRRPDLSAARESNIPGLFVIGDLAGAPVIKLAMAQGYEVVEHLASLPGAIGKDPDVYDVLVVGAGAAGLNAALAARDKGMRCLVLEKEKVANTIENFPEGKWVYAEPDNKPAAGKLWLDGARKEDLLRRWHQIIEENQLEVRTDEGLQSLERRKDGGFLGRTEKGNEIRARRIILATGQRGNPRKLKVPGEEREQVYHMLYSPKHYEDEDIVVVGGGNSAVEAALTLSERNRVTLVHRRDSLGLVFHDNRRKFDQAVKAGRIEVLWNAHVTEFGETEARITVEGSGARQIPYQHAFVLVGAELSARFLKSLGIRLENEWTGSPVQSVLLSLAALTGLWFAGGQTGFAVPPAAGWALALISIAVLLYSALKGSRWATLGVSFLIAYTIYAAKLGEGLEFWPYRGWGFAALSFFERPWSFWYTVLYTLVMTVFGLQALKRWGLDRKDKFQIWRYVSLLSFQWTFFFLVPEFLFKWAVEYQWVGARLANDPTFADQAWRSYGIIYAWPLFFYTFFYDPHQVWVVWGILLSFVILPVLVIFHGKRYCSWICGCGGLAETLGDRWRHLAPKGPASRRWERMNWAVLGLAAVVTILMLLKDTVAFFQNPAARGVDLYHIIADVWLVGIIPVTLYPFMGGKVWCRYWCPLAKMMEVFSRWYTRLHISRFRIVSNDKCIGCMECTRNCQVGIDVMNFAVKQEVLDNSNSCCIGCGICVSVCPMDVLSFRSSEAAKTNLVQIETHRAA